MTATGATRLLAEDLRPLERPPVPPGHLGAHTLGRLAAGELSPSRRAEVEAHLASCASCRARLEDEEATRRAFLVRHPAGAFLATLEARRPRPWWRRLRWRTWLGAALASAAALTLAVQTGPLGGAPAERAAPTTRLKATYDLSFHVRRGELIARGRPGGIYHPGDAIQLRYSSPTEGYLIVVSVDSAGAATAFYDEAGHSIAIDAGVAKLLEGSVILDDALGPERIIGCFSRTPLATADVLRAARGALASAHQRPRAVSTLDLPCAQVSFDLDKRLP